MREIGSCIRSGSHEPTADAQKRTDFPVPLAAKNGPSALLDTPKVTIGTIHSVKGGQADVVYLFPDLSRAGASQYRSGSTQKDSVIPVFYVGATRARERLVVCQQSSTGAMAL